MNNVLVATYRYRHEGELARGFLADVGIRGVLAADAGDHRPDVRVNHVQLFVRADEAERARNILTDGYDVAFG